MSTRLVAAVSLSVALAGLVFETTAGAQQLLDRILARVGDQIITLSDVRAARSLGLVGEPADAPVDRITDALIERELMRQEAARLVFREPPPSIVDARLAAVRSRFASDADFEAALDEVAMTEPRLRVWLRDDVVIAEYIEQRFSAAARPTTGEVEAYYREHREELAAAGLDGPLERVRTEVAELLRRERRTMLVNEWVDRLRERIPVTRTDSG